MERDDYCGFWVFPQGTSFFITRVISANVLKAPYEWHAPNINKSNQTVNPFFPCEWNMAAIWHLSSALLSWTLAVTQEICTPVLIREPAKAISHDIAEILLLLTLSASVTKPRWSYLLYSQTVNHSILLLDPPSAALQPYKDAVRRMQPFIYIYWCMTTLR